GHRRAGGLGRGFGRAPRHELRGLPLGDRRGQAPGADLEARALRRRRRHLAASRRGCSRVFQLISPPLEGTPTGWARRPAEADRPGFNRLKWRWPRRLTSAPASTDTVAAFRPWRGFRSSVARGRRGHHGDWTARSASGLAERAGFEPAKRV